jgi:serine/threonine protein kinase
MTDFQPSIFSSSQFKFLTNVQLTGKDLGRGAYATVQEVNWLGTSCAAKKLHENLLKDDSQIRTRRFIENFEKECMTWSRLVHPCIVQFLGVHFLSGSRIPMLILEKMDTSLRNYLEAHKKEEFPLSDKVYILRQVAQALSYLHSLNPPLVHHDLSPNNVLLNAISLQTKVTDFGMSRALDPSKMTRKSSVKGTHAFMPPEGLVDPPVYDDKLDIFSYGNIIVTTTTHMWPNPGQPTKLEGKKLIAVSELQRRQQYLDQFTPKESELFLPVVQGCLQNDPSERPTSIQLVTQMSKIERAHPRVPDSVVIGQLRQTLDEKNTVLDQSIALLHQKDTQLGQKEAQLHQKDAQLHQKDAQLHQKDAQLQENQKQLREKDAQLCMFQEEMKHLRQETSPVKKDLYHRIGELTTQLEEKERETESWKGDAEGLRAKYSMPWHCSNGLSIYFLYTFGQS